MRLEGWPQATALQAAILRDARKSALLRMRSARVDIELMGLMPSIHSLQDAKVRPLVGLTRDASPCRHMTSHRRRIWIAGSLLVPREHELDQSNVAATRERRDSPRLK
jgi:hypothetical protein